MNIRRMFCSSIKLSQELIAKRLRPYLEERSYVEKFVDKTSKSASILLPLYSNPLTNRVEILVIKRSDQVRSHTGMIAFAGGMMDSADIDAIHTAKREADEEIGLQSSNYSILGCLPPVTDSRAIMITPVVALLNSKFDNFRLLIDEASEAFYLDLEQFLYREKNYRMKEIGDHFVTHHFDIDRHHIWGVTAFELILLATMIYQQIPEFAFFRNNEQLDLKNLSQQLKTHFHLCIDSQKKEQIKHELDDISRKK